MLSRNKDVTESYHSLMFRTLGSGTHTNKHIQKKCSYAGKKQNTRTDRQTPTLVYKTYLLGTLHNRAFNPVFPNQRAMWLRVFISHLGHWGFWFHHLQSPFHIKLLLNPFLLKFPTIYNVHHYHHVDAIWGQLTAHALMHSKKKKERNN